jgi:5-methylcytosine-specific restriction protein A
MKVTDLLKPNGSHRVMDLVAAAGVDVSRWAETKGPAASNPKYCYEWAFIEPGKIVVLNVWHGEIRERNEQVLCELNPRAWSEKGRHARTLRPSERGSLSKRAYRMDEAIAHAFDNQLPIRLIVGEGSQRDISNPASNTASRMKLRLLDPEPWSVERYNSETGECRLTRGAAPLFVDQYTTPEPRPPGRYQTTGIAWERDRKVRDAALLRAGGKCELCHQQGFRMTGGAIYLETHHVIPLCENGPDHESNVVAICANDHREAHHGERREAIRANLLAMLAGIRCELTPPCSAISIILPRNPSAKSHVKPPNRFQASLTLCV